MSMISMQGFRPPPRFDNTTWVTMLIEESSSASGTWVQIDSKDLTHAPYTVDTSPEAPLARDFTTELGLQPEGTGWYRVRFADAFGNTSESSDPVFDSPVAWLPSIRQAAARIRIRTVERETNKFLGTFTNTTRPTDDEAWESIVLAESDVISAIGRPDAAAISADGHAAIQSAIALRAAMIIELSYYAEQVGVNKSAYPAMERDWERVLPQLIDAIEEDLAGNIIPDTGDGTTVGGDDGGGTAETEHDIVVPAGSRVHTKTGVWLGTGDSQYEFPQDVGGLVNYDTDF